MNKKSVQRLIHLFTYSLLLVMLSMFLTACGSKDVTVDDYGDGNSTSGEDGADKENDSLNEGKSFQELYGEKVDFAETFTVGNTSVEAVSHANIPENVYPAVYNSKVLDDGKADEEKIVNELFGDSAKKLNEFSYNNSADYVTFIEKYNDIKTSHEYALGLYDSEYYYGDVTDESDPKDQVYKWVDDPDIYIHMYEGKFNGIRYGLILAYDYTRSQRIIFFDPISIKDYYPDSDFNAFIVEFSKDTNGNEKELSNACNLTEEEAEEKVTDFLKQKLLLSDGVINLSSSGSGGYEMLQGFDAGVANRFYFIGDDSVSSVITFVDGDMKGNVVAHREPVETYKTLQYSDKSGSTDFYVDGYAIFLNSAFPINMDGIFGMGISAANYGMIKVTQKGLYGLDITLYSETLDVTENVNVLEFDKIKESFKQQLNEKLDKEKMNIPRNSNKMHVYTLGFLYYPYFKDENVKEFSYIPTWMYNLGVLSGHGAVVYQNAIDGQIIDIVYY